MRGDEDGCLATWQNERGRAVYGAKKCRRPRCKGQGFEAQGTMALRAAPILTTMVTETMKVIKTSSCVAMRMVASPPGKMRGGRAVYGAHIYI